MNEKTPLRSEYTEAYQLIEELNNETFQMQELLERVGTPRDSKELRTQITKKSKETIELSRVILRRLQTARYPSNEKIKWDKLNIQFQEINGRVQEVTKQALRAAKAPLPEKPKNFWNEEENHPQSLQKQPHQQQKMSLQRQYDLDSIQVEDRIIDETNEETRKLAEDLKILHDIFVDTAHLVEEGGEMITTIETSTTSAVHSTDQGVVQLRQASDYQKSANTKTCCLALTAVIFVGVVVLVVALYFGVLKK